MAMYYQSNTEIQGGDGLQTLYLMNPNYLPYSDTQSQPQLNNMLFFNPHAPPLSHNPSRPSPVHQQDISVAGAARHHYGMWGTVDQNQQTPPRGLSLSLSARHQESSISGDLDFPASESNVQREIMGSKYLKIAQELLDEVVKVGNDRPEKAKAIKDSTATVNREAQAADKGAAAPAFAADDLTTAQKQEIQMKKVKLNTMLDEVEQRCREYHHQMQIIIASFEQAAGTGSAKSYTQLALKTILKQFRCLKSTISAQIKGLNKSLGEEEDQNEGSRLKFVDQQLRQQRALQQLGMMQPNAWRPQRGLPERAVSVLRAWLFQHFLHPYPKDSDKQMLAKQTGLTRSQVSNWFINARVRLWKPMVEEMYVEETKKQQQNNVDGPSIKPESTSEMSPPAPAAAVSPVPPSLPTRTNFAQLISSLNMDNLPEKSPKKPRNADHERFSAENYLTVAAAANINGYGIDQHLAAAGNNFSLSLGLPPARSFLSHRSFGMAEEVMGGGGRISEGGPTNIRYEILDFQNRKSSFPPQLLPDFVT